MRKETPADDETEFLGPSKSQLKREAHALQQLGQKMSLLNASQLDTFPLSPELREALGILQQTKTNGGKQRYLQYVGRLMRETENPEALYAAYERLQASDDGTKAQLHFLENWRTRLLAEGHPALTEYADAFPQADLQIIRQLIQKSKKETLENKPPGASRKLYQYLKEMQENAEHIDPDDE